MVLAMARPWKHPKTGIYWLRRRVPDRLRAAVGKIEVKQSLGTRDPVEAKRLHAAALVELDHTWTNLLQGERSLSEREAGELAQHFYYHLLGAFADNPSEQHEWDIEAGARLFTPEPLKLEFSWTASPDARYQMEAWCEEAANARLHSLGISVDDIGRKRFVRATAKALQAAAVELASRARTGFVPTTASLNQLATEGLTASSPVVTMTSLIEGWQREASPTAKTLYAWRRSIDEFVGHVGHENVARMTADDVLGWKTKLLEQGLAPRTLKFGKLAAVRAVVQWGVDNRKLKENFAAKISVSNKVSPDGRKRGFTDDEASQILVAANKEKPPHLHWIPWICAFTGARVSEVCQLRKEDVLEIDGIACVRFVPEAGSLKNEGSERAVPLHPALVERGFLKFVAAAKVGPLFPTLKPDRFGSRGGNGTKIIGRWVRGLGLIDPRLSPSHSWRHRFKTLGRRHGMAEDISNAITGHGARNVADRYGEYQIAALARELGKIPAQTNGSA